MSYQEPISTEETGAPQVEVSQAPVKAATKLTDTQKEAIVGFIEYLVDTLTFTRVFLIALVGILAIGLFSLFEHRGSIMNHIISIPSLSSTVKQEDDQAWELSEHSKASLVELTRTLPIKFIDVTDVDLKKNSREVRFVHVNEPHPAGFSAAAFAAVLQTPHSVFDYDSKNTAQMVGVLANEFKCNNYVDTIYYKIAPEASGRIATICHMAIPPFVGQFVGYLTVGLERKMSKTELDTIRLELSRVAVEIYLQDVTKQPPVVIER